MKTKFHFSIFCIVMFVFVSSTYSSASENISGIWRAAMTGVTVPEANNDEIYLSIHSSDANIVIIILSAIETTNDLFSSTYMSTSVDEPLNTIGVKSYYPDYDLTDQVLTYDQSEIYNDTARLRTIRINIHEDGQSGVIYQDCDVCEYASPLLQISKVL